MALPAGSSVGGGTLPREQLSSVTKGNSEKSVVFGIVDELALC